MKGLVKFLGIISFITIILTLILFEACRKDFIGNEFIPSTAKKENNIHNRFLNIYANRGTIQNRDDTTTYTISEAIEYLNDGLNMIYCRPGKDDYNQSLSFTDTNNISVTNNKITEANLVELMDSLAYWAGDHYYGDTTTTKTTFAFISRTASSVYNNSIDISTCFIMEKGSEFSSIETYPYGKSWPYGFTNNHTCNNEQGGKDAPDFFRRDLRRALLYRPFVYENYFFTDPYVICFSSHSDDCDSYEIPWYWADEFQQELDNGSDDTSGDNYYESPLFYNYGRNPNFHACLDTSEMNFHYLGMKELVEDNKPSGKVIGNIEVGYNKTLSVPYFTRLNSMMVFYFKKQAPLSEFEDVEYLPWY